jgi:hypothetical protein
MRIHTVACAGALLHLLLDGANVEGTAPMPVNGANATNETDLKVKDGRHWTRVEVRATAAVPVAVEQSAVYQPCRSR